MVKISGVEGVIQDDESGQPLVNPSTTSSSSSSVPSSAGAMTSYTNALTEETQLFGTKVKNYYVILFCGLISLLLGFKGFILALLILGIGYYVIGAPTASSTSGNSSGGGGGAPRRSNIRGIADYPKPPPKSC